MGGLGGINITASIPVDYFPPYTFKRDNDGNILGFGGEEYYNDSVPVEGVIVDYLDALQELSEGEFNVIYRFGSRASRLVHPSSTYTAVVGDVEDGVVDLGAAPFFITGERLKMAPFTVPICEFLVQSWSSVVLLTQKCIMKIRVTTCPHILFCVNHCISRCSS